MGLHLISEIEIKNRFIKVLTRFHVRNSERLSKDRMPCSHLLQVMVTKNKEVFVIYVYVIF